MKPSFVQEVATNSVTAASSTVNKFISRVSALDSTLVVGFVSGITAAGLVLSLHKKLRGNSDDLGPDDDGKATPTTCIYLDYNGTTPVYPPVLKAMLPYFGSHFGNPSSGHQFGKKPRIAVNEGRKSLLHLLGVPEQDQELSSILFTGCGTESDNLAIQLALQCCSKGLRARGLLPHIITSNVEHPAVEGYLKALEKEGKIEVTFVPVKADGRVVASDFVSAIQPHTILVTLMLANNESGAVQPVAQVAKACREKGVLMHTDAAQAVGKISVDLQELQQPDMMSIVGHKIGAPKGIAALYVRPGCLSEQDRNISHDHGAILVGGGQEFGFRGGTENVPYIVGLGKAAEIAKSSCDINAARMEANRSRLIEQLTDIMGVSNVRVNGPSDPKLRLPNTLSVGLKGVHSGDLLATIGDRVAASAGATCHSAAGVSSVLRAMQVPEEFARGTLRLSVGPSTTSSEIDSAALLIGLTAKQQLSRQ